MSAAPRSSAPKRPCAAVGLRPGKPAAHRRVEGEDGLLRTIVPAPRKGSLPA